MSNTYFEEMADKMLAAIGEQTMQGKVIVIRDQFVRWFEHAYERGRYAGMQTILRMAGDLRREIDAFEREIKAAANTANVDVPT